MENKIYYNANLKWYWLSDKAFIIIPTKEQLNKYGLIPPFNIDDIPEKQSCLIRLNDFSDKLTAENFPVECSSCVRISRSENHHSNYDESFINECLEFCKSNDRKVLGYIIVDFIGKEEVVLIRCNRLCQ